MARLFKNILFFIVMLAACALYAQQSLQFSSKALTWQDCTALAAKNNTQYKTAQKNLEIAKSNYNLALNQYGPAANIQYGYQRSNYNIIDEQDNWSLTLSASQNIFNWEAIANIRIQKENFVLAQAQLQQASAAARYNLRQAYLGMIYAQEGIRLAQSIYQIRQASADMIRLQYEGGNESKGNTMRADALAFAANNNIKTARRNLDVARKNLIAALGIDWGGDFIIQDKLNPSEPKPFDINGAVENMPQIIISKSSLEIARRQLSASKAGILPNLTASGAWGLQDSKPNLQNSSDIWSLSVMLSYPIFANGLTASKENIDIAKSTLAQNEEALKQQYLSSKAQLQAILSALETDADTIESNKLLLASAEQMDKEANIQYLAGLMDFQIWQGVEQDLVNYKTAYLTSLYTAELDAASKDNLLGIGLTNE